MTATILTATATDPVTGLQGSRQATFTVNNTVAPLIGARGGAPGGDSTNALANFTNANNTIGPLNCTKIFYSGILPAQFPGSVESTYPSTVTPVVCYKTVKTNVQSYVRSVTRPLWLVYHQEPEGDYATGAQFVSEFVSQAALIRQVGNPLVRVVYCAAGYPYRTGGDAQALAGNYIVPASSVDVYAKDVYQDKASLYPTQGLANYPIFQNWYNFVRPFGKPIAITEYGIGSTGTTTDRNNRLQQDVGYLRTLPNLAMWQYWWANNNPPAPATNWQFTDAPTISTWRAIIAGSL
jgi:hypothetical protein